jgi:hypothetical protein
VEALPFTQASAHSASRTGMGAQEGTLLVRRHNTALA